MAVPYLERLGGLRGLVDEIAPASWSDPRWWALVSTVAAVETLPPRSAYLLSDASPGTDTFMAWPAPRPRDHDPIGEAIALARAAATAIGGLDGALIDQPLAGAIAIGGDGARLAPLALDTVAFAVGDQVALAPLDASDAALAAAITALAGGALIAPLAPLTAPPPARACCTIAVGDDTWPTARHGHRRAWTAAGGPWLGLARIGDHLIASTSHYAIDGYGHALLARAIAAALPSDGAAHDRVALPPLAAVPGAAPLAFASRTLATPHRATTLAYRLGVLLGDQLGRRRGMSPTIQIPVAPGRRDDPDRWRRRVLPALVSVRWHDGAPEPEAVFARRAAAAIAREADGRGLASRVNAAGRAIPLPVRWKRQVAAPAADRASWVAPLYDILAGRGCVSVIRSESPAIAVSLPPRHDATGATVVTVVGSTLTVAGTGRWGTDAGCAELVDQLLSDR
jgi:hypothetical protein